MAFYKKMKMKVNGKWYPKSILVGGCSQHWTGGKACCSRIYSKPCWCACGAHCIGWRDGRLYGAGTLGEVRRYRLVLFHASTNKNGVATEKEVTAKLINGVRVRFLPETRYRGGGKGRVSTRGLSNVDIEWEEWKGKTVSDDSGSPSTPGGSEHP